MNLKKLLSLLLLAFHVASSMGQISFGQPEIINHGWMFHLGDVPGAQEPSFNDRSRQWKNIDLPHDWSVREQLSPTLASATGYLPGGIGWYRKALQVPQERAGSKVYLYFEGVYNRSEVFVNGQSLGQRPNGYVSFMYDATPYIKYGEENLIAVRVDHSRSADSRWYTGSGIYRNVWAVYAHAVHIAPWGVFAYPKTVEPNRATTTVEVELNNESVESATLTIQNEMIAADGKVVARNSKKLTIPAGGTNKLTTELNVNHPKLWSIESPNLYQIQTTISQNGKIIDQTTTTTGFRTLAFDANKGFALNGNRMKIKGVCLHHDAGVLGAAVPRDVWKRRLMTLKEVGCNAIRTSHNPQSPDLYQLCDELGLLVMNEAFDEWEFPKRKWIEGWNVGTPGFQGSYDFFDEWGERDLADMVRRDRNHISIFAWSIGNEVDYPNDPYSHPVLDGGGNTGFTQPLSGGYRKDAPDAMRLGDIAGRLVKVVKKYDSSRPATAGLAGVAMSNETEYPDVLDIAGYNYTESRYLSDHEKYPRRVIYGSENRHELGAWKAVRDNEHISGQFLWTGIDYLGEARRWPSRGFYSGLLDFCGFIKPRGYFRQSIWSEKPMAYLGTYPVQGGGDRNPTSGNERSDAEKAPSMDACPVWNYEEGQLIRVVCYTNATEVRLELNGKSVGQQQHYNDETGIVYWDIPYQAGKLEVTGLDKEKKEVSRYAIRSSGRPYALTIQHAEREIRADGGLAQIVVQVVDENGIPVMLSDDEVTCNIIGPAQLLGLEAGNNSDMSDYTDNVQRTFRGRILAYVQATGEAGAIEVQFTSPWLEPVAVVIKN